jgi:hypothetical protein
VGNEDKEKKASLFIFLGLSSCICKMKIIIEPAAEYRYKDEIHTYKALQSVPDQG